MVFGRDLLQGTDERTVLLLQERSMQRVPAGQHLLWQGEQNGPGRCCLGRSPADLVECPVRITPAGGELAGCNQGFPHHGPVRVV